MIMAEVDKRGKGYNDEHISLKSLFFADDALMLSWRSGKRPRLRARRVKVRFSLRAIILSLENLNVIIRAIN